MQTALWTAVPLQVLMLWLIEEHRIAQFLYEVFSDIIWLSKM